VNLSAIVLSMAAGMTTRPQGTQPFIQHDGIRNYTFCSDRFVNSEIACPATKLRDVALARWVRKRGMAVDVRTSEDLDIAIANGIHPANIFVHSDSLCEPELRCAANIGAARVIVDSSSHANFLALCSEKRIQGVLVRMTDPSLRSHWVDRGAALAGESDPRTDDTVEAIVAHSRLTLKGLDARIGLQNNAFVSCTAAIGHMIVEMARIRDQHATVLTLLGLHIDCSLTSEIALRNLAERMS
jgi:diaminopimelate decarboxylase